MAVTLLDANVLLALGWPNHTHSSFAHRWFIEQAASGWATCSLTQLAFLRHSTNQAIVHVPVSAAEAVALLQVMTARPNHVFWPEVPVHSISPGEWSGVTGYRQVTDAYLALLAKHHGGRVVTFDRAFASNFPERVELIRTQ